MIRALLLAGLLLAAPLAAREPLSELRQAGEGYAQVTPGYRFEFPRDHGAHPAYRIEWWYLTANLQDPDGRHWGVQWTLFRNALDARPVTAGWASNQVWMAHAAITTPDGHHHEQRLARGGIGQAGVSDDAPFEAWLDDWRWLAAGAEPFPARLEFSVGEHRVELQLRAEGDYVLHGERGYSQKSALGQASYYYSQPRIRVEGRVSRPAGEVALTGQGWLDREWSSQALGPGQSGWDWFSLHFDDGAKLMVYRLREADGEHWRSGTLLGADGGVEILARGDILLQVLRRATIDSADGERELPLEWRVELPGRQRAWRVRPLYDQQWLDGRIPYWEGVVFAAGEDGAPGGIGYMELTGY